MLHLSSDLTKMLECQTPSESILVNGNRLCLYFGQASTALRQNDLLNIVLWDGDQASGLALAELENSPVQIKFQERMKKLNSSEVVNLSESSGRIYLQHWEGFKTEIDADDMTVVSQKFTK